MRKSVLKQSHANNLKNGMPHTTYTGLPHTALAVWGRPFVRLFAKGKFGTVYRDVAEYGVEGDKATVTIHCPRPISEIFIN